MSAKLEWDHDLYSVWTYDHPWKKNNNDKFFIGKATHVSHALE